MGENQTPLYQHSLKWLWYYSQGSRKWIALNIVLGLLQIASMLLFVLFSKALIDRATGGSQDSLLPYIIPFALALVSQQLCSIFRERLKIITSTKLVNRLREAGFSRIMQSCWSGKEHYHSGEMVNRLEKDAETISQLLCSTIPSIIVNTLQFFAAFLLLKGMDSSLAWALFLIMPLMIVVSKLFVTKIRRLTHNIRNMEGKAQSHIQENIQRRTIYSSMSGTQQSISTLKSKQLEVLKHTKKRLNFLISSRLMIQCGFAAGYITAFVWGAISLQQSEISYGVMVAFIQLVAQIQNPIINLSSLVSSAAQSVASIDRLAELYQLEQEAKGKSELLSGEVGIRFQDVSFSYKDGTKRDIFKGFSYDFSPNRLYAIVGRTGIGKSTAIRLILSLLKPNSGQVEIYNTEKSLECSPQTRQNFVYVPQGNTLSSGTIRENLLLANPTANDEEIAQALQVAVAKFVYNLPQGLDTICGESGAGLSEGEAQRLAIARGLLHTKAKVLLLDEPTASLDPTTEKQLIERLKNFAKNKTIIMVTHRELAAYECDTVVPL